VPPSHGVSSGPKITAFHSMMLFSVGVPLMPLGGSFCVPPLRGQCQMSERKRVEATGAASLGAAVYGTGGRAGATRLHKLTHPEELAPPKRAPRQPDSERP
jgi:hypothetical protein